MSRQHALDALSYIVHEIRSDWTEQAELRRRALDIRARVDQIHK